MENLQSSDLTFKYKQFDLGTKLRNVPPPFSGVDYAIKDMGLYLAILIKEEQIMDRPDSQIALIMEWLNKLAEVINFHGIDCYVIGRNYNEK